MFGFARRDDDNGRDQQQQDQLDQQDDDRSVRPKTPLHLPANTLLRMDRFEEGGGRRESGGGVGEGARGGDGASHPPDLGSTSVTPPPASKSSDTLTKPPNGVFESGKGGEKVGERDEGEIIERVRGQIPQSKSGPASPLSRTGSLTGDYPSGTLPKGPPQSLTKPPKSREGDILLDFQGIGGSRDDDSNNRRTNVSVSKLSPRMDEVKKVESHSTVDETVGIDSDTTIDDSSGTGSNPATSSPDTSINVNYSEHTSFSSGGGATEEDASGGETVEEDAPGIELDTTVSSRPAEISAYREHSIAALDSVDPANASTFDEDKSGGVDKHNRLASPGSEGVEEDGAPKTDPDPFAYSDGPKDKPGLYDNNITFVSSMNGDGIEEEAILETATSRSRRVNRASVGAESQALNNVKDMPTSALAIELFPSSLPEASAVDLDHGKNQGEQDQEATDGHMRKVQGLELDEDLSSGSLGSLGTSFIHDLRVATRFSSTRGNRGATKTLDISSLVDKSIAASDMPYSVKFLGSVLWHQMVGQSKHASMSQFLTSRPTSNCEVYHNDTQENYADSVTETSTERANGWLSVVSEQSLPNVLSSFVTELGTLPSCQKRSSAPSLHTWEAIVHESQEEEEGVRLRSRVISKADSGLDAKMLVEAAQSDMACFESIVKQITKRNVLGMTPKDNLSSNFGTPFSVGIKSESAVVEKAERKYLGDVTLVKDVLRAQIVLPSETQLVLALLSLQHICDFTKPKRGNQQENDSLAVNIARIKNLFRLSPLGTLVPSNLPTGYRHIIVNLRMKSGLIAEIQLHLEQMFTVLGNDGYKLHRDIIEIEKQRYNGGNEHEQGTECQQSKRNPLLLCRCAESLGISDADGSIDMITGKLISMAKAKSKGAAKKPSFSKKGDGEDTASHVVPMDPGAAMMAAIAARKGPSEDEEKKGEEEAPMDPRAAMMAAIAVRKGPSDDDDTADKENAWKDGMEKGHVGNLSGDAPIPPGSFLSSHLPALDDNFEFLRSLSSDLTQLSSEDVINAMLFSGQEFLAKDESEVFSYICLHEGFSVKSSLFGSDKDMKLAEQIILQGISVVDGVSVGGTTTRVHNCLVDVGLRNSERALEMLASLAVFEGTHRDWGRASDTLQSAVLRCENSLPLYHPVTIASIIDLAAAHLNSGCEDLALSCITRANRRIGFYLREQEDAYLLLQRESSVLSSPFAFHRQHTNGVGIAHLSMLKAYVATLLRMERRKMARLCGPKHPMSFLFHCYLGDALAVLANCIGLSKSESLSSTQICLCCGNKEDAVSPNLTNSTSDIWELAGSHYRTALQGWIRSKGPFNDNISATACSLARCLRECGRRNEAIKVLALVARKAKQVSPQSGRAKNESGPMCLWSMAVFSAEESTTEVEGRKRAGDILGATAKLIEEQRMELPEFQFAKLHALVEKELSKMKS